jgi:GTP-binding protein HflX
LPIETQQKQSGRRTLLVGVVLPGTPAHLVEDHLDELAQLAESAGAQVVGRVVQARKSPDPSTFVGRGKAKEIGEEARILGVDLLVFDDDLSGGQVKSLEEQTGILVMDRSGLILDIFDQRAQSREARTQVELARLRYQLPRLTRRWSHLSRQAGGIGMRGGEGEKQLEQDRRVLRVRIRGLEKELAKIERTRRLHRKGRRGVPTVALTGYTNAGKSTLFNRLTDAGVLAEDRVFATLDARLRRGSVNGNRAVVFADTVGFIRKLPHHLVSSFRSTLGELLEADLVLHLVDRSHPQWREQMDVAEEVMAELGVDPARVVTVFNKSDRVAPAAGGEGSEGSGDRQGLWISAKTGFGLAALQDDIARRLGLSEAAE